MSNQVDIDTINFLISTPWWTTSHDISNKFFQSIQPSIHLVANPRDKKKLKIFLKYYH